MIQQAVNQALTTAGIGAHIIASTPGAQEKAKTRAAINDLTKRIDIYEEKQKQSTDEVDLGRPSRDPEAAALGYTEAEEDYRDVLKARIERGALDPKNYEKDAISAADELRQIYKDQEALKDWVASKEQAERDKQNKITTEARVSKNTKLEHINNTINDIKASYEALKGGK